MATARACPIRTRSSEVCPRDCGICQNHTSHTALGNIDLTNRCNLTCPICFANSNVTGKVYEPSKEQIMEMLQLYRNEQPVAGRMVQFSGGEPTIHPDFLEILRGAKAMGFSHIQVASNGIKFADRRFHACVPRKRACTPFIFSSTAWTTMSTSRPAAASCWNTS